jgi:hypothetical protein
MTYPIRMCASYLRLVLVMLALPLALAACQSTGASYPPGASPATSVDVKIAEASKKLAQQCYLLKVGIMTATTFVHDEKVTAAIAVATPAVNRFCDTPPQNVADATAQVALLVNDLNRALSKAAPPPVAPRA